MAYTPDLSKLDYSDIKSDLKTYLQSQDKFKDYDFEGSNINVLLDILAYNTWKNNFYTNMAFTETYLDSAQRRQSVVSHAKELNYLPKSRVSSKMLLNLTFSVPLGDTPSTITIPEKTPFVARCNNKNYVFYNEESVVVTPNDGSYTYTGLPVYEGRYLNEYYTIDDIRNQDLIIRNNGVDISSVRVFVSPSENDLETQTEYIYKNSLYGVGAEDKVFYIEPYYDDQYIIQFGQNVFGVDPEAGNVVRIEYRITAGERANGINNIAAQDTIDGYDTLVTKQDLSRGGAERESTESIRFFAPKYLQIQNRTITETDYSVLLKNEFPEIQAVNVFGGEKLNPPLYGKVVVAVDLQNIDGLSDATRTRISDYLSDKTPIAIEPVIQTAKFMYARVVSRVFYDVNATRKSTGDIDTLVRDTISNYSYTNLEDFRKTLRYSKLVKMIDDSDESILSNDTDILGIIALQPNLRQATYYNFSFENELEPDEYLSSTSTTTINKYSKRYEPAVYTSRFTYVDRAVYIQDDSLGNLDIVYEASDGIVPYVRKIGTVNYTTGEVKINSLTVTDFGGNAIKVYGKFVNKDIAPAKDRILSILPEDISITVTGTRT